MQDTTTHNSPPKLSSLLLNWALPKNLREPISGDLSEEYIQCVSRESAAAANIWYWHQALKTSLLFIFRGEKVMSKTSKKKVLITALILLSTGSIFYVNMEPYQKERVAGLANRVLAR